MSSGLFLVFLCAFTVGQSHRGNIVHEHVDLIELNHFYDQQGRHVYDQVIFYERCPDTGKFKVRAWCLVEDRETLSRRPIRDLESNLYQVNWFDSDQRLLRKITSRMYRESWTQVDPERANKRIVDERLRTSLVQNPKRVVDELQNQALRAEEPRDSGTVTAQSIAAAQPRSTVAP